MTRQYAGPTRLYGRGCVTPAAIALAAQAYTVSPAGEAKTPRSHPAMIPGGHLERNGDEVGHAIR